jgi:hypothetical protein
MKNHLLLGIHAVCVAILVTAACSGANTTAAKIKGEWRSTDNVTILKITAKQFTMDSDSPIIEDYFIKGDTIYTSFQGNLPYTKFVVKQVDGHKLKLLYPDSVLVEFTK